jgi:ribosome-associated protein
VQSIAELVADTLKKEGAAIIGQEGLREGQWALIDFGGVVLHVFHQFTRQVYDLDGLWARAPRLRQAGQKSAGVMRAP